MRERRLRVEAAEAALREQRRLARQQVVLYLSLTHTLSLPSRGFAMTPNAAVQALERKKAFEAVAFRQHADDIARFEALVRGALGRGGLLKCVWVDGPEWL
jgi:hypothetical protein